jgi:hypothetical protein
MQAPLVSILVRSMDRPTLARALRSAIGQTYPQLELIVVAASGPAHRDIPARVGSLPVRAIRPAHPLDRAAAANAALRAAQGRYLNFLDDDDELLPHHVATLLRALDSDPAARLAFSRTEVVDQDQRPIGVFGEPHTRLELFDGSKFCLHAALFDHELLDRGVGFDQALPVHEDHDFWIQCAQHTRFRFVDEVTNRWHACIGTSGAGGGPNKDNELLVRVSAQVRGKWAAVREEFERSPEGLIQRAQAALKSATPEAAHVYAEQALRALPDDVNALNLAAMANHYAGHSARAKELIDKAMAIVPGHPGLLKNQRIINRGLGVESGGAGGRGSELDP